MIKEVAVFLAMSSFLSIVVIVTSEEQNAISLGKPLKDGDTIVSSGRKFELGFFSPGSSKNRYVGIWYANIPEKTYVWVANRDAPITSTLGVLEVKNTGIVVLDNDMDKVLWSANASRTLNEPVVQLLDTGNLVLRENNDDQPEEFLWESFDLPTDTLLPGMKLGKDFVTGLETNLSSWKSVNDPAPGDFTLSCDHAGYPQVIIWKGSLVQFRCGPWNGIGFSLGMWKNPIYNFSLVVNEREVYYSYTMINGQVLSRLTLNQAGYSQRWNWADERNWVMVRSEPADVSCGRYLHCGAYGSCESNRSPQCACLDKFKPKNQVEWDNADWSSGCMRNTSLNCTTDGFMKLSGIKLPDARYSWYNRDVSLKECENLCQQNCSCMAYSNLDVRDGSGCLLWSRDLLDIEETPENTQEIYVRMASSDLGTRKKKGHRSKLIVLLVAVIALLLCLSLALYAWRRKKNGMLKREVEHQGHRNEENDITEHHPEALELPIFDLLAIANATNNFSIKNKLGEGGFGPVYKGVMEDGKEIAVKRLSKTSGQGIEEFKNEVICISKLQHRNLVKLLGCCIQGVEKMLIYEYMPNKSLDYFIFDETRRVLLDWPNRFNIINGIARGLQYLHQDSRLRIIHRDLKASNILLDFDMNPKISDFGIARSFAGNQTEANTQRVIGTYGYMSPEYAIDGLFSVKSDVFSFGVLVLEIVSGRRNRGFTHDDHHHSLLGHAWILHNEGKTKELIDPALGDSSLHLPDVLRSIHVGLLCVQRSPEDRPSMSKVVVMLSSDVELPPPKQPGFYTERFILLTDNFSIGTRAQSSSNEFTITLLEGR